jgi:hypothetical protein
MELLGFRVLQEGLHRHSAQMVLEPRKSSLLEGSLRAQTQASHNGCLLVLDSLMGCYNPGLVQKQ